MSINDAILEVTGGPTINDGLAAWYGKLPNENLNDAVRRWLLEQGATPAQINDMWYELLREASYTGSLNDMRYQWWLDGGAFVSLPLVLLHISNMGLQIDAAGGTLVNGRSTPATVQDFEGNILDVLPNEIRYSGARRVENFTQSSNDIQGGGWLVTGDTVVVGPNEVQFTTPQDALIHNMPVGELLGRTFRLSLDIRGDEPGTVNPRITNWDGQFETSNDVFEVTAEFRRYSVSKSFTVTSGNTGVAFRLVFNTESYLSTVHVQNIQMEEVTSQSNQNPSNYQDSETLYNSGITGVESLNFENGNTVDGKFLVVEANGPALSPPPIMLHEGAGENLVAPSADFDQWTVSGSASKTPVGVNEGELSSQITFGTFLTSGIDRVVSGAHDGSEVVIQARVRAVSGPTTVALRFSADEPGNRSPDLPVSDSAWTIISFALSSVTGLGTQVRLVNNSTADSGDVYVAWMDFKVGARPSSYIPTLNASVTRDADQIQLPFVDGVNFNHAEGVVLFRGLLDYESGVNSDINAVFSILNSSNSLLRVNADASQVISTDGIANAIVSIPPFTPGQEILMAVVWSAAEADFVVGVSMDGGDSFIWSVGSVYSGSFPFVTFISLYWSAVNTNRLLAAIISGELVDGDIEATKTWIEINAGRVTEPPE